MCTAFILSPTHSPCQHTCLDCSWTSKQDVPCKGSWPHTADGAPSSKQAQSRRVGNAVAPQLVLPPQALFDAPLVLAVGQGLVLRGACTLQHVQVPGLAPAAAGQDSPEQGIGVRMTTTTRITTTTTTTTTSTTIPLETLTQPLTPAGGGNSPLPGSCRQLQGGYTAVTRRLQGSYLPTPVVGQGQRA